MNFNVFKRSFSQMTDLLGGGWIALLIALIVLGVILFFVFRSGKQIKIRIPFLPKGMNTIKLGKDDLKRVPGVGGGAEDGEDANEKPVVGRLFDELDLLSGSNKKRYEIPLYLVVSQYESAASLLDDSGEDVLQRLDMKDSDGNASGSCVILDHGGLIYHESPELIATELIASRPERPLDGIVFVIPAADLLLDDRIERRKRTDWLFKQYWSVQNEIEFTLPVYFVIAGAEVLDGFAHYAQYQQARSRLNEIFGWSNPYNVDTPFNPEMIDAAFENVGGMLSAQINDLVHKNDNTLEGILAFPNSVNLLREPVKQCAEGILSSSLLIHTPKFRGVYLTGKVPGVQRGKHNFLQRLFRDKVFPEHALANPVNDQLLSADGRLRRLQVAAAVLFLLVAGWTGFNINAVMQQSADVESVLAEINGIWRDESGYDALEPSLQLLAKVNASEMYCCGPTPWSWLVSPDNQIRQFFQREVFTKKIFPVMECQSRQMIFDLVKPTSFAASGALRSGSYPDWLANVSAQTDTYARVRHLTEDASYRTQEMVYGEFSDLVLALFDRTLPVGFGDNSDLYIQAISNSAYDPEIINKHQCESSVSTGTAVWGSLIAAADAEIAKEVERVAAPLDFLDDIIAFESGSLDKGPISSAEFLRYVAWHQHLENSFVNGRGRGFCADTSNTLQEISGYINAFDTHPSSYQADIKAFQSRCEAALIKQMEYDNERTPRPIYSSVSSGGMLQVTVSPDTEQVFDLIDQLSEFTFSTVTEQKWTNRADPFFWSVDLLITAMGYADDYFGYAKDKFKTNYLPANPTADRETYLAQAVALAQLQRAMLTTIEKSKFRATPGQQMDLAILDAREAKIADRVANFRKALNPLLALVSTFEQLGLGSAKKRLVLP